MKATAFPSGPQATSRALIADARQRAAVAYAESRRVLADHRTDRAAARAHSRRIIEEARRLRQEADAARIARLNPTIAREAA